MRALDALANVCSVCYHHLGPFDHFNTCQRCCDGCGRHRKQEKPCTCPVDGGIEDMCFNCAEEVANRAD